MIYLDNAATSYPKPPQVARAAGGVIDRLGGNPGRAGHTGALCGARVMERCRKVRPDLMCAGQTQAACWLHEARLEVAA